MKVTLDGNFELMRSGHPPVKRGGGDSAYESDLDVWMLVGNFELTPKLETDLGVAQAFCEPLKETMLKHRQYIYIYIFSHATLNETYTAKYESEE